MAKKKIKDLTLEEIVEICNKNDNDGKSCVECPLNKHICYFNECVSMMGCRNETKDLEQEIEVEEDKLQRYKSLKGLC